MTAQGKLHDLIEGQNELQIKILCLFGEEVYQFIKFLLVRGCSYQFEPSAFERVVSFYRLGCSP
jgi:hypothetical protein